MKSTPSVIVLLLLASITSFSQVGINTTTPDASAILDVTSTTQGFLPPRMTTAERDAIASPAVGLTIFNTTTGVVNYYEGSSWQPVASVSNYVDLTTNQTIAGTKTFNGTIVPVGRMMLPMGELNYFNTTGTTVSFTGTSDGSTFMTAPAIPTTLNAGCSYEFDNGGADNGTLRYTGATTKYFHIAVTISGTPEVSNHVFVFAVAKNGVVQTTGKVLGSSSGTQFSSLHIALQLSTNDTIRLYMGNTTNGTKTFTCKSLNVFAMGI